MGKDNDAPPAPDYGPIAAANEASAKYSFELGKEQLAFYKQQYADNKDVTDQVVDLALGSMERNDHNAQKDRERYENIFQPLEEQLAKDAQDYANPQRIESEAGKAEADVAQQFEQARATAQANLESFGIDPSQTRAGAMDLQSRVAEAAAQSSAGNQARERTENIGRALRSEAINVGKGYPGQIAGQYGTSQGAGNQSVNSGLATTQSAAQTMGTPQGWQGMGNQALTGWGNTLNMGYNNQLDAWKAESQASSGMGSALGMLAGTGLKMAMGGFEEGGSVVPAGAIPAPGGRPPIDTVNGASIPPDVSASRGAIPDDVDAKLTVGEFVFPEDVSRWYGEEKLQKMIMKARADKEQAPAKPTLGYAEPSGQPPAVQSSGAIPTRQ